MFGAVPLADALKENVLALVGGAVAIVIATSMGVAAFNIRRQRAKAEASITPRKIHTLGNRIPFVGDLLEYSANSSKLFDWITSTTLRFNGEPWMFRFPGVPDMVFISEPEAIEDIMSTQFDTFQKGAFQLGILQDVLGQGMLSCDGERWYHQRKTAAKFFSAKTLRAFMVRSIRKNLALVSLVLDQGMSSGKHVDLGHLFHEFTMQTFTELGLGIDMDMIGNPEPHPFAESIERALPIVATRGGGPAFVWKLQRWLQIGKEKELRDAVKVAHAWITPVIAKSLEVAIERLAQPVSDAADGQEETKSVMDLFVEHSREDAAGLRTEDLVDFIFTLVVAARDTSALALSWFFYGLHKHPHVEQKIREEMAAVLGDLHGDASVYLTTQDIKPLLYLEATIKESLRLYAVAPYTMRETMEDTVIGGDIFLRKGQYVGLSPYAMARNPRLWGPDAAEFKPERWIDPETQRIRSVPSTKFLAFGAGPRICIGMNLAMLEIRVVTANLLNRYRFEVDPSNDGSYVQAVALGMKHPLLVTVSQMAAA